MHLYARVSYGNFWRITRGSIPAPNKLMAITTTRHIVIQTDGFIFVSFISRDYSGEIMEGSFEILTGSQKDISTDAALISAGKEIIQ